MPGMRKKATGRDNVRSVQGKKAAGRPKAPSKLELEFAFQIHAAGLPAPESELTDIVPGRRYRFDLGWRNAKLLVEINGGIWGKGGHSSGAGINRDTEKCNLATLEGWTVLSVTSNQIHDGRALRWIQRALVNGLQGR